MENNRNDNKGMKISVKIPEPEPDVLITIELSYWEWNDLDAYFMLENTTPEEGIRRAISGFAKKGKKRMAHECLKERQAGSIPETHPDPHSDYLRDLVEPVCAQYGWEIPDTSEWTTPAHLFNWVGHKFAATAERSV